MNYIQTLIAQRNEAQQDRQALLDGITELRAYLTSDKFNEDKSVNSRDVLARLQEITGALS